jgi:hypothetical protein
MIGKTWPTDKLVEAFQFLFFENTSISLEKWLDLLSVSRSQVNSWVGRSHDVKYAPDAGTFIKMHEILKRVGDPHPLQIFEDVIHGRLRDYMIGEAPEHFSTIREGMIRHKLNELAHDLKKLPFPEQESIIQTARDAVEKKVKVYEEVSGG